MERSLICALPEPLWGCADSRRGEAQAFAVLSGLVNRIRPSVQTCRFRVFVTGTSATRGVLQFLLYQDIAQMGQLKMVVYKQPGCEQLWFLSPKNSK